jgi:hypothetical protein
MLTDGKSNPAILDNKVGLLTTQLRGSDLCTYQQNRVSKSYMKLRVTSCRVFNIVFALAPLPLLKKCHVLRLVTLVEQGIVSSILGAGQT